jgi:hypothetical protein
LKWLNKINGIVQQIQWLRSKKPPIFLSLFAFLFVFFCRFFSVYLPFFFNLFAKQILAFCPLRPDIQCIRIANPDEPSAPILQRQCSSVTVRGKKTTAQPLPSHFRGGVGVGCLPEKNKKRKELFVVISETNYSNYSYFLER